MSMTQSQFEVEFQLALDKAGFEYSKKDTQEVLDILADTIAQCLKKEMKEAGKLGWGRANRNGSEPVKVPNPSVRVRGLGVYRVNWRPGGWGKKPFTGERVKMKPSKRLKALPLKGLKDNVGVK